MVSVKGRKIRKAVVVKKPSVSLANRIQKKKKASNCHAQWNVT